MLRPTLYIILAAVMLLSSCKQSKDIVYLADMEPTQAYTFKADNETIVKANDLLSITVSCRKPELAVPFNVRNSAVSINAEGDVSTTGSGVTPETGYRVDKRGDITFPVLGKIHVAGFRLTQIADIIREKIIDGDYIKDPQVSVDLLNFKYTVMGAVAKNGTFSVDGDRVTLLEAIANAGDVLPNGKTTNVKVIREVDGKRMVLEHDLTSREMFDSPFYYLKPNDIVYVEPKYKSKERENRGWQISSFIVSIASLGVSAIWAFRR